MAIDWDAPDQPDFVPGNTRMVNLYTIEDAVKLLDEWREAYEELRTAWARTHHALEKALFDAEMSRALRSNLDPYLPRWLQDEEERKKNPALYEQLAQYRRDDYKP